MNEADALDLVRNAMWTLALGAGPAIAAATLVGVAVGLFQALTQIQEATLSFVPKIVAVFLVLSATATFVGAQLYAFTEVAYGRIERGFAR